MIINKYLATRCLAGQNFISSRNIHYKYWQSEIQFLILQTVKKKTPFPENILSSTSLCFIKNTFTSRYRRSDYNLFIASSTSRADRYLLVICHSRKPCFTSNIFRVHQSCKNLIKSLGFFFAFTNEKSSVILKEHKVAANICNVTDRQKAFVLFFLRIHLASD